MRDLEEVAAVDLDEAVVEERDEREDFVCTEGEADDLEEPPDATESRALEAAALRGGMLYVSLWGVTVMSSFDL